MIDNKLEVDEAQRAANYEAVKSEVEHEVNDEIAAEAQRAEASGEIRNVAGELKKKAVGEVITTENEVERARSVARISQIVDYIFFLIYAMLGIRLMLALLAARSSAGFVQFVRSVTDPFYAPFKGIVPSISAEGGFTLALPIVVALVVYMILHLAINGLLRIFVHRKTTV